LAQGTEYGLSILVPPCLIVRQALGGDGSIASDSLLPTAECYVASASGVPEVRQTWDVLLDGTARMSVDGYRFHLDGVALDKCALYRTVASGPVEMPQDLGPLGQRQVGDQSGLLCEERKPRSG